MYIHGKDYTVHPHTTIAEEYPLWVWTRLRGPILLLIIDSLVLLAALVRMGCILRKHKGLRINVWYMLLHYSVLTISIATLFQAFDSKNLKADETDEPVRTFRDLLFAISLYMAFKFVLNTSICFIIFGIAKKQKNLKEPIIEKPAEIVEVYNSLSTRAQSYQVNSTLQSAPNHESRPLTKVLNDSDESDEELAGTAHDISLNLEFNDEAINNEPLITDKNESGQAKTFLF